MKSQKTLIDGGPVLGEAYIDKWLFILKNLGQLDKISVFLRKPIFEKLFNIAEVAKLTKLQRGDYNRSLKARRDFYSTNKTSHENGKNEGKIEGKIESKIEVIRNLHAENRFSVLEIARFAGVTEEFVKETLASGE